MNYFTLMAIGVLLGMQHATEADHLAAVAAMSARPGSRRYLVLRGSFWGIGHTATLLVICGILLIVGGSISSRTQALLDLAVGVMVMLLGGDVLRRLWQQQPHFHFHRHESGEIHAHLHSHVREPGVHDSGMHYHEHQAPGLGRAVMVGMIHGAAGSAALLVFAAASKSPFTGISYVLCFGVGSIIGMATLSFLASWPLGFLERCAGRINTAALAAIGGLAIVIGGSLFIDSLRTLQVITGAGV